MINCIKGKNWVSDPASAQSVYRSELASIDGVLSTIEAVLSYFDIDYGHIEVVLDGQSALGKARDNGYHIKLKQACFDLIQDIRNRKSFFPEGITITWR